MTASTWQEAYRILRERTIGLYEDMGLSAIQAGDMLSKLEAAIGVTVLPPEIIMGDGGGLVTRAAPAKASIENETIFQSGVSCFDLQSLPGLCELPESIEGYWQAALEFLSQWNVCGYFTTAFHVEQMRFPILSHWEFDNEFSGHFEHDNRTIQGRGYRFPADQGLFRYVRDDIEESGVIRVAFEASDSLIVADFKECGVGQCVFGLSRLRYFLRDTDNLRKFTPDNDLSAPSVKAETAFRQIGAALLSVVNLRRKLIRDRFFDVCRVSLPGPLATAAPPAEAERPEIDC